MIPGDIDLTENLDFRNIKKRELPQLPASWKGKDRINISTGNLSTYISTNDITYNIQTPYTFSWTYTDDDRITTTIRTRGIREVHNDSQLSWSITSYDDDYLDSTIYTWNRYDEINYTSLLSSNIYEYDNKISVKLIDSDKSKYDVFGNKIKQPEQIPKIPWSKKLYTSSIPSIPWSKRKWTFYNEDYIPNIPWDVEDDWMVYRNKRNNNLSSPIDRAKKLISWLSKKSSSFIDRYFEKDEDVNTSYLTNMSWIHVHDAVIDLI